MITDLQKIALMSFSLLATGGVLLAVLALVPATADRARALSRLMLTEVLIVGAAVSIFLAGKVVIELAVVLIAFRVGLESAEVWILAKGGPAITFSNFVRLVGLGVATSTSAIIFLPVGTAISGELCLLLLLFALVVSYGPEAERLMRVSALARVMAFPGIALLALGLAAREPRCYVALLLAFMLTEVFDSFAVLGGRLMGRHLLFPRLSPNKSLEGWFCGLAALVFAICLLPAVIKISPNIVWIAPATIAAAATAGDLLGSAPKRVAGVKDYSAVLVEQGGLLDILDAWLLTGPVLACLWFVIG